MRAALTAIGLSTLLATAAGAQPVRSIESTRTAETRLTPEERARAEAAGELVCRKVKITGSRLKGGKVCQTRAEVLARKAEDKKALDRLQGQRTTCDPTNPGC